jgi:hypothetical protein
MKNEVNKSQLKSVLTHLINWKRITSKEAYETYGIFRLAAIIHVLRKNYLIKTRPILNQNGNIFAEYEFLREKPIYSSQLSLFRN